MNIKMKCPEINVFSVNSALCVPVCLYTVKQVILSLRWLSYLRDGLMTKSVDLALHLILTIN